MNITLNKTDLEGSLSTLSPTFRKEIIDSYLELKKRHVKSFFSDEYDAVGLSSGKFCEIVFRFLQYEITGRYTPFDKHISNFPNELQKLTQEPSTAGNDSLRIIIPRGLAFLYTLRNKRGIGHVGGDIKANAIDISTIVKTADWIICELIRIYHNLSINDAQNVVDSINVKIIPDIWVVNGVKRVLKDNLSYKQKVLLLLYNEKSNSASLNDLLSWTEYSSKSMFKSSVITPMHKAHLVHLDNSNLEVALSPKGLNVAEGIFLQK